MARNFSHVTALWPSGSYTSAPLSIPVGHFAGGIVHISGAWTDAQLGLDTLVFGQWNRVYDWQGGYTGVTIPSARANASIQCPPAWFYVGGGDNTVRLVSVSGTGSGIPQGNARTLVLELKD
jgi:hypothetical protein